MTFWKVRNHRFIYCIILLCVCITHYFQELSNLKLEWQPAKSILAQAKSATYKNFNNKQQQAAAGNEDPED